MRLTLTPASAPPDGARLRALGWDVEPELDYDATAPVVLASLEALWREARRDSGDYSDHDVAGFLPPPPAVERAYVAVAPRRRSSPLAAPPPDEPDTPRADGAARSPRFGWSASSRKRARLSDMTPDSESGEPCHEYRGAALPRTRRPLLDGAAAEAFLALIIDAASETFEKKRRRLLARIKDIRRSTIAGFLDACAASGYDVPRDPLDNADPYYFDWNVLTLCEAVAARAETRDDRLAHAARVGEKALAFVAPGGAARGARVVDAVAALLARFVDLGYCDHATADATERGVRVVVRAPATLVAASVLRDGGGGGAELLHVQAARALLASRGACVEAVETDRRGDDLVHDLTLGT